MQWWEAMAKVVRAERRWKTMQAIGDLGV